MKHLRHLTAITALLCFFNAAQAQWVSIPDTMFGTWLYDNGYSLCLQGDNTQGWLLNTYCINVQNAGKINCTDAGITDLTGIEYFNLDTLVCNSPGLTVINQLPPNLIYLDLSIPYPFQGTITTLPVLPPTLTYLSCNNNQINALPALPDSLDFLDCGTNQLTALPALPIEMYELYVADNQLTGLPTLPPGLAFLDCSLNPLATLPVLPASLLFLSCLDCQLSALPALPPLLGALWAHGNSFTALPALPGNLTQLLCGDNQLTTLPALPGSIQMINCPYNLITALPALPPSLSQLTLDGNPISVLPSITANKMQLLSANHTALNTITSLPTQQIDQLSLTFTNLTSLPELPDSIGWFSLDGNAISCLPELKKVSRLNITGTNITCLPNYPADNISSQPPLSSLPLCNYFNNNGCNIYWNVTGKSYEDTNADCIINAGESGITNLNTELWQNGTMLKQTVSSAGFYSFDVTAFGTYQITIDSANLPFNVVCPATGSLTSIISAADSMDYSMDFALECKPGFDLEAKSIATNTIFRPANFNTMEVAAGDASNFYNGHCAAGVSGTVTLNFTGPVKYIAPAGGALTPTVTGNTLTYNIANFGAVNFFEDFDIITQTDTTAQANQQICFTLSVTPTSGDNNPTNNTFSICYTVVNSFDPNDKAVYPAGNIDTTQRDLVYTIRFQNTGNAEAQHIYITDTLSNSINPASFQLLAYSHAPMVQLDGNKLRFNFPNINLPDSTTNEPASHGYVQFKVKLNTGLPVGTVINNTAYIYFDFNAPVITNTATNTIYIPKPPVPVSIGKYRIDRAVKPNGRL